MAAMRAAVIAPTWPDINGKMMPVGLSELSPWVKNLAYNPIMVHFIHRGIAYLLFVLVAVWWFKAKAVKGYKLFSNLRLSMILLISLQVVLGILTVLNATYNDRLVFLGVAHQFTAMLVVLTLVCLLYVVKKPTVS
jgi:cytochrome c oxidase assembly protein subunit 15